MLQTCKSLEGLPLVAARAVESWGQGSQWSQTRLYRFEKGERWREAGYHTYNFQTNCMILVPIFLIIIVLLNVVNANPDVSSIDILCLLRFLHTFE